MKATNNKSQESAKSDSNKMASFWSYVVTTLTVLTGIVIALTGVVLLGVIGIDKQGQVYLGAFNLAFAVYWLVRANTRSKQ